MVGYIFVYYRSCRNNRFFAYSDTWKNGTAYANPSSLLNHNRRNISFKGCLVSRSWVRMCQYIDIPAEPTAVLQIDVFRIGIVQGAVLAQEHVFPDIHSPPPVQLHPTGVDGAVVGQHLEDVIPNAAQDILQCAGFPVFAGVADLPRHVLGMLVIRNILLFSHGSSTLIRGSFFQPFSEQQAGSETENKQLADQIPKPAKSCHSGNILLACKISR